MSSNNNIGKVMRQIKKTGDDNLLCLLIVANLHKARRIGFTALISPRPVISNQGPLRTLCCVQCIWE